MISALIERIDHSFQLRVNIQSLENLSANPNTRTPFESRLHPPSHRIASQVWFSNRRARDRKSATDSNAGSGHQFYSSSSGLDHSPASSSQSSTVQPPNQSSNSNPSQLNRLPSPATAYKFADMHPSHQAQMHYEPSGQSYLQQQQQHQQHHAQHTSEPDYRPNPSFAGLTNQARQTLDDYREPFQI